MEFFWIREIVSSGVSWTATDFRWSCWCSLRKCPLNLIVQRFFSPCVTVSVSCGLPAWQLSVCMRCIMPMECISDTGPDCGLLRVKTAKILRFLAGENRKSLAVLNRGSGTAGKSSRHTSRSRQDYHTSASTIHDRNDDMYRRKSTIRRVFHLRTSKRSRRCRRPSCILIKKNWNGRDQIEGKVRSLTNYF